MIWHSEKKEDVAKELQSQPKLGLTDMLAGGRLKEYGPNIRVAVRRRASLAVFLAKLLAPLSLLLLLGAGLWLGRMIWEMTRESLNPLTDTRWLYPLIILLTLIALAAVRAARETAAADTAIAMTRHTSGLTKVRRGAVIKDIPTEELVPGDIVQLEAGDIVPADGRLLITTSFRCDEAVLTGSPLPVRKNSDAVLDTDTPLARRCNMAYAGTAAVAGRALMIVTETGAATQLAGQAKKKPPKLRFRTPVIQNAYRVRAYTVWLTLCLALSAATLFALRLDLNAFPGSVKELLTFLSAKADGADRAMLYTDYMLGVYPYDPTFWSDLYDLLLLTVLLAVCAIPLGLPQNVIQSLTVGMKRLKRKGCALHDFRKAERIGAVTLICTDKTGTLTRNDMTVAKAWPLGDTPAAVAEGFWSDEMKYLMKCAALCCDSKLLHDYEGNPLLTGDRTEAAIVSAFADNGGDMDALREQYPRCAAIPFDSDRRLMTVIHEVNGVYMCVTKGAPDVLAARCLNADDPEITRRNTEMCDEGLRVIAVAVQTLDQLPEEISPETVEHDMIFIGLIGLDDPCREDVRKSVKECADAGVRTVLLTGDQPATAAAVASQLGMMADGDLILTGEELDAMADAQLRREISRYAVFARISPQDKVRLVKAWQQKGERVLMTAGGLGDAPALCAADVSCAMQETAADIAVNAADITISGENYMDIRRLLKLGRSICHNLAKLTEFSLACCVAQTAVLLGGKLFFHETLFDLLPLLLLNLLLFVFIQPFFADEPPERDVMRGVPERGDGKLAGFFEKTRAWLGGGLIAFCTLALYRLTACQDETPLVRQGKTLVFVFLTLSLVLYGLCVRSHRPFIVTALARNRGLLLGAVAVISTVLFMTMYDGAALLLGFGSGFLWQWREIGALLLLECFVWQYPKFYSYIKKY